MSIWLTILLAGLLTFGIRYSFIYLTGRWAMPDWFMRALQYVPVAVLSAIIVPETVSWHGAADLSLRNPQIWAGLVAILVGLKIKNVVVIIAVGVVAFVLAQWLIGIV